MTDHIAVKNGDTLRVYAVTEDPHGVPTLSEVAVVHTHLTDSTHVARQALALLDIVGEKPEPEPRAKRPAARKEKPTKKKPAKKTPSTEIIRRAWKDDPHAALTTRQIADASAGYTSGQMNARLHGMMNRTTPLVRRHADGERWGLTVAGIEIVNPLEVDEYPAPAVVNG